MTLAPFRVRLLHEGRPLPGALVKASLFVAQPAEGAASGAPAAAAGAGPATSSSPAAPSTAPALPFGAPAGIGLAARTDAEGRAVFALPRPGTWLLTSVHMLPAAPGTHPDVPPSPTATDEAAPAAPLARAERGAAALPTADWESLWASLSFEVPAPR